MPVTNPGYFCYFRVMPTNSDSSTVIPGHSFDLEGSSYSVQLFRTCNDPLFTDIGCQSLFQRRPYHRALEAAPPEGMDFWYARIEKSGEPIGMLCFQVKGFNPGDSLRNQMNGRLFNRIRYTMASWIQVKVLCLGNTLVTGDYGFCFHSYVPDVERTQLMMETIDWMLKLDAFRSIRMVFIKDFFDDIFAGIPNSPHCKIYHPIDTQPNMIMPIDPQWGNLNGYLKSLKSKYRVRANKALSLVQPLERVELTTAEEIAAIEDKLHALYLKVAGDVGFNLFILAPNYFSSLKRELGKQFRLWVYKENGKVISFLQKSKMGMRWMRIFSDMIRR